MNVMIQQYDFSTVAKAIDRLSVELMRNTCEDKSYIVLTLLDGGMFLTGELMRRISVVRRLNLENYTMKVSSYHGQERGKLDFVYTPDIDWKGREVIVIDDFCDSGATLNGVYAWLKMRGVKSVQFYTMLARDGYQLDPGVDLHYGILDKTKNFYIGCGLDDNNKARYVDFIYYLQES